MSIATFAEASQMLGYSSPSTLYKLRKEGQLEDYLVEILGKPKLKDYLGSILRWRIDGVINNHY